ncbi:DUF3822 family protein [Flavobacteriales bacterium]|nr:DUF3822 family protein [Flavobacteriales bacterium]
MSKFDTAFEYFDTNRLSDKYNFITTIWLSSDGCSVSGYSNLDDEYIYLAHFPDFKINIYQVLIPRIKDLLNNPQIETLIKSSTKVKVVVNEARFTLIPESIYDASKMEVVFKMQNQLLAHEELESKSITDLQHRIVFPINDLLKSYLQETFEEKLELSSYAEEILNLVSSYTERRSIFHVDFSHERLSISFKKDNQLLFHNSFNFSNEEDAIYFIVYTLEKLQLSVQETEVSITGNALNKDSQLIEDLGKYVSKLDWLDLSKFKALFFKLNLAEVHRFPYLFNA